MIYEETEKVAKMMNFSKIDIGTEFGDMFRANKTLIHIDLSHNNFKKSDCELMEQGLRDNHTLLGIHMIGNELNTNSKGYFKD